MTNSPESTVSALPVLGDLDFDAYLEKKWGDNRFNMERMKIREKVVVLCSRVLPVLNEGAPFVVSSEYSEPNPSVWNHRQVQSQDAWFLRSPEERRIVERLAERESASPQRLERASLFQNLIEGFHVRASGCSLALVLHREAWADFRNLHAICREPWKRDDLYAAFEAMGEPWTLDMGEEKAYSCSRLKKEDWIERMGALVMAKSPMRLERQWSRTDPAMQSESFGDVLVGEWTRLHKVFLRIAWHKSNDVIGLAERIRQEKKSVEARGLRPGDDIVVVQGLFSGRTGELLEMDSRGSARISIGGLNVKIPVDHIVRA